MAIIATALWLTVYPSLEEVKYFHYSWILQIWIINFLLVIIVAGSLHYYFYVKKRQGRKLKFDHRDQTKNNRNFLFANQVKDNMFWSLTSGVFVLTTFQVITMWLMANGYTPLNKFSLISN